MVSRVVLVAILVGVCYGQALQSKVTLDNCLSAPAGDPCVEVVSGSPRDGWGGEIFPCYRPASCSLSSDKSQLLVSDLEGLTVYSTSDMSVVSSATRNCPSPRLSRNMYGNSFLSTLSTMTQMTDTPATCFCQEPGNCRERIVSVQIGASQYNSTYTCLGEGFNLNLYSVDEDVIDAPVILWDCTDANQSAWEWLYPQTNSVLFVHTRAGVNCPNDYRFSAVKWAYNRGYKYIARAEVFSGAHLFPGVMPATPGIVVLDMHGDDALPIYEALINGTAVSISFGPSFLGASTLAADVAPGLATISASSVVTPNTTFFKSAEIIEEQLQGGRPNIVWATILDGNTNGAMMMDVTDPSNPVVTDFSHTGYLTQTSINCTFRNASGYAMDMILGCVRLDPSQIPFAHAISKTTFEYATSSSAFFSEAGSDYAILSYNVDFLCRYCDEQALGGVLRNLDLWDVTSSPAQLVDRYSWNVASFEAQYIFTTFSNGYLFFTNATVSNSQQAAGDTTFFAINASLGFNNLRNGNLQVYTDANIPADALIMERYNWDANTIVVSYAREGTVFYSVDASGISGIALGLPSRYSNTDADGGAVYSCGNGGAIFVRNDGLHAASGAPEGLFSLMDVQIYDLSAAPGTSTSSSTTSTTSTSSSSSSTSTSSTSTSSGGAAPSPTRTPSPSSSSSSCVTPDACKYECSKPADPSKVPKPSVNPSKAPAASKVPEPEFFTIELTYESTAADCGANGPDCCDVREWLGDDSVAASFYLCSSDSTTKNRAPEYDSKDGTCTVFLAAQEGSDVGEITQAEFDSALATLEASFSTLCPTDVKNCNVNGKSGQSLKSILGSGAASAVSALLVLAAVAVLL